MLLLLAKAELVLLNICAVIRSEECEVIMSLLSFHFQSGNQMNQA